MNDEIDILSVTTTVGSMEDARQLARKLIDRRLAACVQLDGTVQSFYRWEGRTSEDAEVRLVIKTLPACAGALAAFFADQHPYEVPQYLTTTLRASAAYGRWVRGEVAAPQ